MASRPPKEEATLSVEADPLMRTNAINKCQKDIESSKSRQSRWSGWRKGVAVSCICNVVVLILNLALLIWARTKPMSTYGTYILWQGAWDSINRSDTILHLGLNVVSAIILAGSNYTLQVLVAPTREDVDRAHHEKRHLDIGISSLCNWRYISWSRKLLYICLFTLTLPVHVLYNSIIFSTAVAFDSIGVDMVTEDFLQKPPSNTSISNVWHSASGGSQWIKMTSDDCNTHLDTYYPAQEDSIIDSGAGIEYSHILLFTNFTSSPQDSNACYTVSDSSYDSDLGNTTFLTHGSWIVSLNDSMIADFTFGYLSLVPCTPSNACQYSCPINISANHNSPRIDATSIEYCLMETAYFSSIELVPQLLLVVIVCSILKVAALSSLVFSHFNPLVTIGDAVASFLDSPDSITQNMGPLSVMELQRQMLDRQSKCHLPSAQDTAWKTQKRFYLLTITPLRWLLTVSFCITSFGISLGFSIFMTYVSTGGWSIIGLILLINTPQLLLSSVYLCYNALFTRMSLSVEWMSFCQYKKGLRVSRPEGEQRSTHFLSLPYRYSIPLATKSILIHWMLSQIASILSVDIYSSNRTRIPSKDIRTISISNSVTGGYFFFSLIAVMGIVSLAPIGFGFRRFDAAMPLARSNSLVISAACHPVRTSEDLGSNKKLSTKKLQYGVISELPSGGYRVGFSDKEVMPLVPGEFYK